MSWLISDDVNTNNMANLGTFDSNKYFDKNGWRLTKNIALVESASQKWQQSYNLDGLLMTDEDFGFERKYNGFGFRTSQELPEVSISAEDVTKTVEKRLVTSTKVVVDKNVNKQVAHYQGGGFAQKYIVQTPGEYKINAYNMVYKIPDKPIFLSGHFYVFVNGSMVWSDTPVNTTDSYSLGFLDEGDEILVKNTNLLTSDKYSSYNESYDGFGVLNADYADIILVDKYVEVPIVVEDTAEVPIPQKINRLPCKGATLKQITRSPYNGIANFIVPQGKHYQSGYFSVASDGEIDVKAVINNSTKSYSTIDDYQSYNCNSIRVYINGQLTDDFTSSDSGQTSVKEGDVVTIIIDGDNVNGYYEVSFDGEYCDKYYLSPKDCGESSFTVYKTSFDSNVSPAFDCAFLVLASGTISWSFTDDRPGATSKSDDGYFTIFKNGVAVVTQDNDRSSNSGSLNVDMGDVVLVRRGSYSTVEGERSSYVYTEQGWDTPGGQCSWSFNGKSAPIANEHTMSWRELIKTVLVEARLLVDENSLTDYVFPIAFINDTKDSKKASIFYEELINSKLIFDLWTDYPVAPTLPTTQLKGITVSYDKPDILRSFQGSNSITRVQLKNVADGSNMFKNCNSVSKLSLIDISGNWKSAFENGLTNAPYINLNEFKTKGLTSAKLMFKGCPIKYNITPSPKMIENFFNDTYDKWAAGDFDFRSAFIGTPYSGTIPEDFMSVEDQFACNWDPAILIQRMASTYDITRPASVNYYYATRFVYNSFTSQDHLKYDKDVHKIKVVSRHYDESQEAGIIYIDDKQFLVHSSRGHCVCVIDPETLELRYRGSADTYGGVSAATIWNEALNVADSNDLIVALSYDATSRDDAARNSCLSCGGSESIGTWGSTRYSHAFIGKKGLSKNLGYEQINSGSSYTIIEAQFDKNGLVYKNYWATSYRGGLNPIYEPRNDFTYERPRQYPVIEVPEEHFWIWRSVFYNIKETYEYANFANTLNNKANFTVSLLTSGSEAQINPNSELSFAHQLNEMTFDGLALHLGKIENTTNKDISIPYMFNSLSNLCSVDCDFKKISDVSYTFRNCEDLEEVNANLDGVETAQFTFENCDKLKYISAQSDTCYDTTGMCKDCMSLEEYDLISMPALKDATSMFENCPSLKTEMFTQPTRLPETLQVAKRMFAKCSITEISGNWVPPNSYTSYRNQDENGIGNLEDDWVNETTKEGWSFPEKLYSAYQMFAENPITKISNLKFNPNANNSWMFQDCHNLTTMQYSYLDVDAYNYNKYTGMFDGCSLKKENVIWLPISISSKFDLLGLGFMVGSGNEKPAYWIVDDHWCEVDHSGFVEYQHIRRPAYLNVYRKNYDKDVIIKFWSHPHIHSAEMRGYNELHDTKVYYDPETLQGGATINYNEWLKGKQTK